MSEASRPRNNLATATLENGMRIVVEKAGKTPAVAVSIRYSIGSRDEVPGRTGLAHLFEHLMFQGSTHVEPGDHFGLMESVGAQVNANTTQDRTHYYEAVPTNALELALWLEADRLDGLLDRVDEVGLTAQRDVVRNERREMVDNQPYGDTNEILHWESFPENHPYRHTPIGSMDDIAAASLDDVRQFFTDHYVPSNAVLTIVGDIDPQAGIELAKKYFGPIEARAGLPRRDLAELPPVPHRRIELVADVPVPAVNIAWMAPAEGTSEADALDLALSIIGGGEDSWLTNELSRDADVATYAEAYVMKREVGNSSAFITAQPVEDVSLEELTEAIHAQLDRLRAEGVSAEDLQSARTRALVDTASGLDTLVGRGELRAKGMQLHNDPLYYDRYQERYADITSEQIQAVSARWLKRENSVELFHIPNDDMNEDD